MPDRILDLSKILLQRNPDRFFENHMLNREEQIYLFETVFTPEWRDPQNGRQARVKRDW
jgi:hypothetical protein